MTLSYMGSDAKTAVHDADVKPADPRSPFQPLVQIVLKLIYEFVLLHSAKPILLLICGKRFRIMRLVGLVAFFSFQRSPADLSIVAYDIWDGLSIPTLAALIQINARFLCLLWASSFPAHFCCIAHQYSG